LSTGRRIGVAVALLIGTTVVAVVPMAASATAPSYRTDVIPLSGSPGSVQTVELGTPAVMVGLRYLGSAEQPSTIRVDRGRGLGPPIRLEDAGDDAPDPPEVVRYQRARGASVAAARAAATTLVSYSAPTWVKSATRVQVTIPSGVGAPALVAVREKGTVEVRTSKGAAAAATAQPATVTREQWGARTPACTVDTSPVLKMAFVHHTVNANDYSQAEAPNLVRAIQAFHMDGNGWCDIGYNFLVDRFGTAYEGRQGSLTSFAVGAHAAGFNTGSVGVAMLGSFDTYGPSSAALDSLERLVAWRLSTGGVDPTGRATMTSGGGPTTKYPLGSVVSLDAMSGHRDTGITDCPGAALYAELPAIRQQVALRAASYNAYGAFAGGVFVAAGRVTGGALDDVVTGADAGGGPLVRVFGADGSVRGGFYAYPSGFSGGARVAVGRVTGRANADIITGAGPGGGPHVRIFDTGGNELGGFFAYSSGFTGGVYVASGDVVPGNAGDEIVTGAGPGGGPHVRVFSRTGQDLGGFFAYSPGFTGGVRVAAGDLDGDGVAEIITAAGPGGGPHIRVWKRGPAGQWAAVGGWFAFGGTSGGYVATVRVAGGGRAVATTSDAEPTVHLYDVTGHEFGYVSVLSGLLRGARVAAAQVDTGSRDPDQLLVGGGPGTPGVAVVERTDGSLYRPALPS